MKYAIIGAVCAAFGFGLAAGTAFADAWQFKSGSAFFGGEMDLRIIADESGTAYGVTLITTEASSSHGGFGSFSEETLIAEANCSFTTEPAEDFRIVCSTAPQHGNLMNDKVTLTIAPSTESEGRYVVSIEKLEFDPDLLVHVKSETELGSAFRLTFSPQER